MDKLPQRSDLIYKEIEEFQDYELTNCIAYEMAIRNEDIKKLLHEIFNQKLGCFQADGKQSILKSEYYLNCREVEFYEITKSILDENKKIDLLLRTRYFSQLAMSKRENYKIDLTYNEFLTLANIKNGEKSKQIIENKFSRPIFDMPNKLRCEISNLNIAFPKGELIAYISKIKDEYDKDNSIIKTPLELLGETLEKSDNKKTPKKPKASVYSDWFYIYDYWKYEKTQGKTDKDIFVALEVENDVPYKEDNLRKIRDKMKYFIDDLGYKELITGVKNS
jgi:hypothetical protein